MKKYQIALLVTTFLFLNKNYGQSKCDIYKVVTDSIYKQTSITKESINQKYPIDPENPDLDTTFVLTKNDYILNINFAQSFDKYDIMNWFARLLEEPSLLKATLVEYPSDKNNSQDDCFWSSSSYCVNFLPKNVYSVDYENPHDCKLNKQKLYNKKISFSSILFSKDLKKAFLHCEFTWSFGVKATYAVELVKKNSKWKIYKIKVKTR